MPHIWNIRYGCPPEAVRVDRSTPWGNPFEEGKDGTRDEVCDKFEAWVMKHPALINRSKRVLRGKDLACWCWPDRCHAMTWLKIANE